MKNEDIDKVYRLTELHIRLSDAITVSISKNRLAAIPLLDVQKKISEEMKKIVNPLCPVKNAASRSGSR